MLPYSNIEKLYTALKSVKWLGGWDRRNSVYLYRRNELGDRKVVQIDNVPRYFCIRKEDYMKISKDTWESYKNNGWYKQGYFEGKYAYIISEFTGYKNEWNNWLKELHEQGIEPLEADISRYQRLIIDLGLEITNPNDEIKPKICFYDIETDDSGDKINAGIDPILSIAIKDYHTGEEFWYCNNGDEKQFIIEFLGHLSSFDVIIGYNNFGFDDICIEGRMNFYGIERNQWNKVCKIDLYNQFERQGTFIDFNSKNKKLDTIARRVVGRGKLEHTEKIHELWSGNKIKLQEYNLEDIRLLWEMEKKLNTANLVMSMMAYSGTPYNLSHSPLQLIKSFLLRESKKLKENGTLDYRLPTGYYLPEHNINKTNSPFARNALPSDRRKGRQEQLEEMGIEYEKIEGGYVKESQPAFVNNVAAFDFQSLYPNTIRAFNICLSTLVDEDAKVPKNKTPNGSYFRTDYVGLMPRAVEILLEERKRIRLAMKNEENSDIRLGMDVLQKSIKILTNSFFGVTGLWGSALYNNSIGNAITSFGRYALQKADVYFTSLNKEVVIQDTDSTYLLLNKNDLDGNNIIKLKDGFLKFLRDDISKTFNCYKSDVFDISFEKLFSNLLVVKKKMYAGKIIMKDGVLLKEPELVIKGLKLIKSDTCKWASDIARQILGDLLENKYDYDYYKRLLLNAKSRLENKDVMLDDLRISSRLGKEFDEYANDNLVYLSIAKRMSDAGILVSQHATINYYITDGNTPMQGIGELELVENVEIDLRYYFNTQLLKIVIPLLEIVYPEIEWDKLAYPRKLKKYGYMDFKTVYTRWLT